MASAHNLGMSSLLHRLKYHLDTDQVPSAIGKAGKLLRHLAPSELTPRVAKRLLFLIENDDTRIEALRSVLKVGQAIEASHGPDAYLPDAPMSPFDVNVDAESAAARHALMQDSDRAWWPRLFRHTKSFRRGPLRRLQDRLFTEMLTDETVKRQMIAFMDAVADIENPHVIAELTRLYFPRGRTKAKGILGLLLKVGTMAWLPDRLVAWGLKAGVRMMASRFLAGRTIEEALKTVARFQRKGIATSVDVVRERVVSQKEADDYQDRVLKLMELWAERYRGPSVTEGDVPVRHISLKLSALTHRFDPLAHQQVRQEAGRRLLKIFQRAKEYADQGKPILINVDLEEYHVRDLTYRIFWEAFTHPSLAGWEQAGIVVQAYLKDAEQVLLRNIDIARRTQKRPQIRIVKGAYHKYEQIEAARRRWKIPVLLQQAETDRNFQRLIRLTLMNLDHVRPATGSHKLRDLAYSQEVREDLHIVREVVEAQVLLGVGDPIAAAARILRIPSRYYGPFGTAAEAIGYLVRRLAEVGPDSAVGKTHMAGTFEQHQSEINQATSSSSELPLGAAQTQRPPFVLAPEANFSKGHVRQAMQDAIDKLTNAKPRPVVMPLIGTERPTPINVSKLKPIENPATLDTPVGQVRFASGAEVDRALAEAQQGYEGWSQMSPEYRGGALRSAAHLVIERQYEIAAAIVAEAGKPWAAALAETREAVNFLRVYALDGERAMAHYEARGVGVAISPFNYPFAITMGQCAAGLALGNAMIAKPAEQTPLSASLVVKILRKAGVPKRAMQLLPGTGEQVGQRLVESDLVDFIAFTGSKATADQILKTAAVHPPKRGGTKLVVAETGGKNALIIDETADLDVGVSAVLAGAFELNGQRCSATSRVIVVNALRDRFLERLIEGAKSMVIGDPRDATTQLGPQIDEASFEKAQHYIKLGQDEAELIYAADVSHIAQHGFYLGPHIFANVDPHSRLAREEIFAPVLAVISAASFEDALRIANNSPYGLTAALISRHPGHIQSFLERMEAGNKYVNRPQVGARPGETPFGGVKNSGTGPKAGGSDMVARFSRPRGKRLAVPVQAETASASPQDLKWESEFRRKALSVRQAQRQWATRSLVKRLKVLAEVKRRLGEESEELKRARRLLAKFKDEMEQYLVPHETIGLPGERNEVVYDHPLGVGHIWGEGERFSDALIASVAALMMGNGVVLAGTTGYEVMKWLDGVGLPADLVQLLPMPSSELILNSPHFDFDFVVAHGAQAVAVNRMMFHPDIAQQRKRVGYRRFIGGYDDPAESRYPTYFAHESTNTERTMRHGADLDIRDVLNPS